MPSVHVGIKALDKMAAGGLTAPVCVLNLLRYQDTAEYNRRQSPERGTASPAGSEQRYLPVIANHLIEVKAQGLKHG